jgi:hypothetical protein
MTRKSLLAFAATLLTATVMNSAAEAGDGVKLNFGYPMGSFVATPAGGGSYGAKAASAHKMAQKKKPSSLARQVEPSEPKAKAAAKKDKPAKIETASIRRDRDTDKSETAEVETKDEAPLTGSKALAGTDAAGTTAETAASGTASTKTAEIPVAAVAEPEAESSETEKSDETADVGCKKFIPAIGVTVSVGCSN